MSNIEEARRLLGEVLELNRAQLPVNSATRMGQERLVAALEEVIKYVEGLEKVRTLNLP